MTAVIRDQWQVFLVALGFFTRVPIPSDVPFSSDRLNQASRYFPLVGLLVGLVGAAVFGLAALVLAPSVALLLSMAATILLTGAFHEDGLADVCDGFGGGWTVQRKLEIMKDSRIGTYGVAGLVLVLLLKYQLLIGLNDIVLALIVGHTLSRAVAASFIYTQPYVRDPETAKVKPLAKEQSPTSFAVCLVLGLLPLMLLPIQQIAWVVGIVLLVRSVLAGLFRRQIGGYTGDCLGAAQQISEVAVYLALAIAAGLA